MFKTGLDNQDRIRVGRGIFNAGGNMTLSYKCQGVGWQN